MSINTSKEIDYFIAVLSTEEDSLPIKTENDNQPDTPTEANMVPIDSEEDDGG